MNVRNFLSRIEPKVELGLALLSFLAVALVLSNELVDASTGWVQLQIIARIVIWLIFVSKSLLYLAVSKRRFKYISSHFLELIVCITWFPQYSESLIHVIAQDIPITLIQLIGTLANVWIILRWTLKHLAEHPLIVIGSVAIVLIASTSALLTEIEPQTFGSFMDAVWYCVVTVSTIGYGDLVPRTLAGRIIGMLLMISGISLAALFIGTVSQIVHNKLVKRENDQTLRLNRLEKSLEDNNRLLQEVLFELKKPKS
jgi:voltage-gated potassium channel